MSLFDTGIRPAIDAHIQKLSEEERDYGQYWSASSAGYCMRLNILRRLKVPPVEEIQKGAATQQRTFSAGHIFHEWIQRITKDAGLSIASEVELQDEELMIRGHIDDLVLIEVKGESFGPLSDNMDMPSMPPTQHLILYDYKTAHSASFNYKKQRTEIGHYHKNQLATYMYMMNKATSVSGWNGSLDEERGGLFLDFVKSAQKLEEARILSISKDDLRMHEEQLMWTPDLEKEIVGYWSTLNGYWKKKVLPRCTCLDHDGGFMGRRSKKGKIYNDYFHEDVPCNIEYVKQHKQLLEGWKYERTL